MTTKKGITKKGRTMKAARVNEEKIEATEDQRDALTRAVEIEQEQEGRDYRPITYEEAQAYAEMIVSCEWSDEELCALLALLSGMVAAHYDEKRSGHNCKVMVESIYVTVAPIIYSYAAHHNRALDEFVWLDPKNERDAVVLDPPTLWKAAHGESEQKKEVR